MHHRGKPTPLELSRERRRKLRARALNRPLNPAVDLSACDVTPLADFFALTLLDRRYSHLYDRASSVTSTSSDGGAVFGNPTPIRGPAPPGYVTTNAVVTPPRFAVAGTTGATPARTVACNCITKPRCALGGTGIATQGFGTVASSPTIAVSSIVSVTCASSVFNRFTGTTTCSTSADSTRYVVSSAIAAIPKVVAAVTNVEEEEVT